MNFENLGGEYRRNRNDGRYICNYVTVSHTHSRLSVHLHSYLGVNWKSVERECRDAKSQIRDRLQREPNPDKIARLVIMLLTEDLVFMYYSKQNELKEEINRRVFNKSPELSAIAFCEIPDTTKNCAPILHHGNFAVFYTPNKSIQPLPSGIFDKSAVYFK